MEEGTNEFIKWWMNEKRMKGGRMKEEWIDEERMHGWLDEELIHRWLDKR